MPPMSTPRQSATASEKALQKSLHHLLSVLTDTRQHVSQWPEGTITEHVDRTSELISRINRIVSCLQNVEKNVKECDEIKNCNVPVDLLDFLSYCQVHPDLFTRGLLSESLNQLAGLQRRKMALSMLATAVQSGLPKKSAKRERTQDTASDAPPAKKQK